MVKVERTFPAPKSLAVEAKKVNGSYSEPDYSGKKATVWLPVGIIDVIKPWIYGVFTKA